MSDQNHKFFSHATLERNAGWLIITTIFVVAIAGLVQIVPLFFQHSTTEPSPGVTPYSALRLAGRDIYQREGCLGCHSQQIRTLRSETERYGPYSLAGESVYDHPFFWGSKRTGPDLARVGERYSDIANQFALPAYQTWDLLAEYMLTEQLSAQLEVKNLTNTLGLTEGNPRDDLSHQEPLFYGRPIFGRTIKVALSYQF